VIVTPKSADRPPLAPPLAVDDYGDQVRRRLEAEVAGKYQILRELGRGGMSIVYQAIDVHLERQIAIKVLPPSLTTGSDTIERFRQEARTAAKLSHPNIVPIYAIGDRSGAIVWFSMAFIDGPLLSDLIEKRAPLPVAEAVGILGPIAGALDYAHHLGIVHRDIKPSNLIRSDRQDNQYMLMDFGIAKALAQSQALTGTGMALGTPLYMSPEQAVAGPISPATDQFSLAVIAYELLTGERPFDSDTAMGIIYRLTNEEPRPIHERNPALDSRTAAVVARALSKRREQRFPSVTSFVEALRATVR
jgi:serine/threonine-protein kinase